MPVLFARPYPFGRVVVEEGDAVPFLKEVKPVGGGVSKEVGEDALGGPKPTELVVPKPKVALFAAMSVEPVHLGVMNPSAGVGQKGSQPRGGSPVPGARVALFPPVRSDHGDFEPYGFA